MDKHGMTTTDWAQVASAVFTALTALAAFASVYRVERDRRRATLPAFHLEILCDVPSQEMRLTLGNVGGPARDVRFAATIGQFGFFTLTGPTSYWRPGETRTYKLSMPVMKTDSVEAFVEAWNIGHSRLTVWCVGGANYVYSTRRAKKLSGAKTWEQMFPGAPSPLDVAHSPMNMELIERTG